MPDTGGAHEAQPEDVQTASIKIVEPERIETEEFTVELPKQEEAEPDDGIPIPFLGEPTDPSAIPEV